jgi:hypothetical protein
VLELLLAVIALPHPSVHPWPVGVGPHYLPTPAPAAVLAGRPVDGLRCSGAPGRPERRFGVHLELFAGRKVVVVPAGIGVARPLRREGAYVRPAGCTYPLRTLEPTGVIEVAAGRRPTLGDLFRLWGQPLGPNRLAGFRGRVAAFVGGRRWRGAAAAIPLTRHAQIVLETGGYVPPHPRYLFRAGL